MPENNKYSHLDELEKKFVNKFKKVELFREYRSNYPRENDRIWSEINYAFKEDGFSNYLCLFWYINDEPILRMNIKTCENEIQKELDNEIDSEELKETLINYYKNEIERIEKEMNERLTVKRDLYNHFKSLPFIYSVFQPN